MTLFARQIMQDVSVTLLDEDFVRWTVSELAGYIDEAVKAILIAKPSAGSKTVSLTLAPGTRQALPTGQRYKQLLDIVRNVQGMSGAAGRAIRATTRTDLDTNQPRWHDPAFSPFRKEVRQFVFDETIPLEFMVVPGNDGTGIVEAIVAQLPLPLRDQVAEASRNDMNAWNGKTIDIDDIYEPAVKDYVLFRCFSKEDLAAAPERAATHYQAFATMLGIRTQVEGATNPARKRT